MRRVALLLVLTVAVAGCLGGNGPLGPSGNPSAEGPGPANQSENASNASGGNGTTGNHTMTGTENRTSWNRENRTGNLSGVGLAASEPTAHENLTVAQGTQMLFLNLTVKGDQVNVTVRPPGCDSSSCERSNVTANGSVSLRFDAPVNGTWNVTLSTTGVGPRNATYDLGIAALAPTDTSAGTNEGSS